LTNGVLERIPALESVRDLLEQRGVEAYIVGGYVRDVLIGRHSADVDIAVQGDALALAREVAQRLGGKYVLLDEANHVARVAFPPEESVLCLDFSGYAGSIESDLSRRDFTVDAMAVKLNQWQDKVCASLVVDPFGGLSDLDTRLIRAVQANVFQDDPARLLRALRLAGELEFKVHPETEALIKRDAALVSSVPGERVHEELVRIFAFHNGSRIIAYMNELGLLLAVFPELVPARGFEQKGVHFWDVLHHCLNTVAAVEHLLRQGHWEVVEPEVLSSVPWTEGLQAHFASPVGKMSARATLLKVAALLHDVAKPQTKTVEPDGRWHFLGHAPIGASVVRQALERLRFSNREVDLVETEVYHHLRPAQMTQEDLPTRRAVYRYFRDTEGAGVDVFFLALADYLATHGPRSDMDELRRQTRLMGYVFEERRRQMAVVAPAKLIDGHDMMRFFRLEPGPRVGELLGMVREAQAAGEVSTREEALDLARRHISG